MQIEGRAAEIPARRARRLILLAVIALAGTLLALVAFVWYPTTLQPKVALTGVKYAGTPCAPVAGGYANRLNATFTLVNTGRADADVGVQFLYDNFSIGYQHYVVPQGAQVTEVGWIIWETYASPSDCGPLGTPGVSLASVDRLPPIDVPTLVYSTVGPVSTLGIMGLLLGVLVLLGRRRGISLLEDLGSSGWGIGVLTAFSAILFGDVVTSFATTSYNYPLDWTPAIVSGIIWGGIGATVFGIACREMLRKAPRGPPPQ